MNEKVSMKKKKRTGVDLHVRLPREVHRALSASAEANRRSLAAEAVMWLERTCPSAPDAASPPS